MEYSKPILLTTSTPQHTTILDGCAHLHAHCILHDHTLATFLPPLSHETISKWWYERLNEVEAGIRHIVVQLLPVSDRTTNDPKVPTYSDMQTAQLPVISLPSSEGKELQYEVAGVVMLSKPFSETGPFRSLLEKLFVSPYHRRKGISRAMMHKIEEEAKRDGRWNILLDTTAGSEAEHVYPRLGYHKLCMLTDYGYSPEDGRLVDEIWFYKDLRKDPMC